MRDNDGKCGPCFARVATTSGIEVLKTPVHAKRPNAICERFPRSVRQECLDHLFIFSEKQHKPRAHCLLTAYMGYFNRARPHQGMAQQIPEASRLTLSSHHAGEKVIAVARGGGLHHDYHWAA